MRKDKIFLSVFPVVIAVLLYLVSCATPPPTKEVGEAESAVAAAKEAGAPDCAPDEFAAAQSALSKGKALAGEFCHELEARRALIDAKAKADEARFKCLAAKKAPAPVPPPPAPTVEEFGLKDIFFDFDKYNIRSDAEPVLQEDADVLKKNPNITVVIEGYADIRGTNAYNLRLAQRRANATKAYLVKLGVDPSRIQTVSKGETSKFAAGSTEEAFQLNRRSHFVPMKGGASPGARIFFKFNDESKPNL
jgi:peptidoglycan-associated lipoprotein